MFTMSRMWNEVISCGEDQNTQEKVSKLADVGQSHRQRDTGSNIRRYPESDTQ